MDFVQKNKKHSLKLAKLSFNIVQIKQIPEKHITTFLFFQQLFSRIFRSSLYHNHVTRLRSKYDRFLHSQWRYSTFTRSLTSILSYVSYPWQGLISTFFYDFQIANLRPQKNKKSSISALTKNTKAWKLKFTDQTVHWKSHSQWVDFFYQYLRIS